PIPPGGTEGTEGRVRGSIFVKMKCRKLNNHLSGSVINKLEGGSSYKSIMDDINYIYFYYKIIF
ncbi:MAG TPA: hypothetical protein VKR58_08950, partial [Aquella sp.]|nr:hypothetical protein [Aquella sp.]